MTRKLLALATIVLGLIAPNVAAAASQHTQHSQSHGRSFSDGH